ncbi:VOC family protein [Paenibacillus sp. CAU 1782]
MNIKETGFILFLENYENNVSFYTEQLGLKVREEKDGLSKLDFGGSYLMIENNGVSNLNEKNRAQNPTVIRIEVQDFDTTVKELESRKVKVEALKFDWGTVGVIIDPEGNRIEIKDF